MKMVGAPVTLPARCLVFLLLSFSSSLPCTGSGVLENKTL